MLEKFTVYYIHHPLIRPVKFYVHSVITRLLAAAAAVCIPVVMIMTTMMMQGKRHLLNNMDFRAH